MPSALLTASTTCLPARAQVARDVVVLPRRRRRARRRRRPPRRPRPPPGASAWPSRLTMPVVLSGSKPPVSTTMNSRLADAAVAVVAVARQAGEVGDDRVAALRHAVEQRRLADVGPADDGDDGLHRRGASAPAQLRRAEREQAAVAGDHEQRAADDDRRRRDRAAVGRQAQLRLALVARQQVQRALDVAEHHRARRSPTGALRPRYSSASEVQATSPLAVLPGA